MKPLQLALCLAALFPLRAIWADDDSGLKINVVVDLTDDGRNVTRPSPAHPAYYYPIVKGYTQSGDIVGGQSPPPPTPEVWKLIGHALAEQGYVVARKGSAPSLLLVMWWGYKAPIFMGATSGGAGSMNSGAGANPADSGSGAAGVAVQQALQSGVMPTDVMTNADEMEQLVFGSFHDRNSYGSNADIRVEELEQEARVPRYYLTLSAMDFDAAIKHKKYVILWTAFVSTRLAGHTMDEVLPALVNAGAPKFGRDTDGAHWPLADFPAVPIGHATIGTPHVEAGRAVPAVTVAPAAPSASH